MNEDTLVQISRHLEFLGFNITPPEEDGKSYIALHKSKRNYLIKKYKSGILFSSSYKTKPEAKQNEQELHRFVNALNTRFAVNRAYLDKDLDLVLEAFYLSDYDKQEFGLFIDASEFEFIQAIEANVDKSRELMQ